MLWPRLWLLALAASGCVDRSLGLGGAHGDGGRAADGGADLAPLAPADLGPVGASAPPWSGDAVAYQVDPMHRGAQQSTSAPLAPPLTRRWTRDLGAPLSYPLVAGGRVFVVVGAPAGATLLALDAHSGASDWGPLSLHGSSAVGAAACDGGRVFAVNDAGLLAAFDAASGAPLWQAPTDGFASPPSAAAGVVYVTAGDSVYALAEADGTPLWTRLVTAGGGSSPIVSPAAVFLPFICGQAYAFDPGDGTQLWHDNPNCDGGGSLTGVLDEGRIYLRNPGLTNQLLRASDGLLLGSFTSDRIPAFADGFGYFVSRPDAGQGRLQAARSDGSATWSFSGDGDLISAPLLVDHVVYVGSTSGTLFAVDGASGLQRWSDDVGAPFVDPDLAAASAPLPGMAAAGGLLVVAAGTRLIAYGP